MKNYIDVKMTVWHRFHFTEEANMKGLVDLIKENGLDEVIDNQLGFVETESLFDTEERMNPADNDGEATIEVYEGNNEIWTNEIR